MLNTKYFEAVPLFREALCENCGEFLRFVKSDFSRPKFSWLHKCRKCGKTYWLADKYPTIDYAVKKDSRKIDGAQPIDAEEDEVTK